MKVRALSCLLLAALLPIALLPTACSDTALDPLCLPRRHRGAVLHRLLQQVRCVEQYGSMVLGGAEAR